MQGGGVHLPRVLTPLPEAADPPAGAEEVKVAAQDDPDYINKCVEGTTVVAEAAEGEDGYAAFAARRVKLRWIGLACRWLMTAYPSYSRLVLHGPKSWWGATKGKKRKGEMVSFSH